MVSKKIINDGSNTESVDIRINRTHDKLLTSNLRFWDVKRTVYLLVTKMSILIYYSSYQRSLWYFFKWHVPKALIWFQFCSIYFYFNACRKKELQWTQSYYISEILDVTSLTFSIKHRMTERVGKSIPYQLDKVYMPINHELPGIQDTIL